MDNKNQPSESPPNSEPALYQYGFWDKEMQPQRQKLTSALLLPLLYETLLMWICLSIFWGSLVTNNDIHKIEVAVVNNDSGDLGTNIVAGIKEAKATSSDQLNWTFRDGLSLTEVKELVFDEHVWATVFIAANSSSNLDSALKTGDPTYNPQSAINLLYTSARSQITINSHVVPAILATINPLLGRIGTNHTETFLQSVKANPDALSMAIACPQCLTSSFVMTSVDLVPFDVPAASGSTMTGLIFLLTFTFSIFQILRIAGLTVGAHLRLRSALLTRTIWSLASYLILALSYTLINLVFGVPMSRRFGHGGFVIFWLLNTCTMGAVGLPMESLFTFIGLKWAGYFLSFWIVVNVSAAFTSFELMPAFYRYGYAFPFYHAIQGTRTIIFGTKNHLGLNFGVLIAWMIVGLIGMYVGTAWMLQKNRRAAVHNLL